MKHYGSVFVSGNSYALRLPADYVRQLKLKPRQRIDLPESLRQPRNRYDRDVFWELVAKLQQQADHGDQSKQGNQSEQADQSSQGGQS